MGEQKVSIVKSDVQMQHFVRRLLNDLQAFEKMLEEDWFENDITRIGAEQEMCLVNTKTRKPAPISMEVLSETEQYKWLETELAKFNLETNLTPRVFHSDALRKMEEEALHTQHIIKQHLVKHNADIVLTGILPTLRKHDLELHNLTPKPRYYALIEAINNQLSKSTYELHLDGIDELRIHHNSPLLEACNTSFQVHLQVNAHNFVKFYNIAQALAAPVMAIAANSPIVFGRRLWHESRIALFQQALDTRKSNNHMRESSPRVQFGKKWLNESVLEIHKDDIARFRVLLATEVEENSLECLQQGIAPKLSALQVFNSTVYRWNRPCYGISENGKPHLRIENRVLPAGPTIVDEMANAALWLGAMIGMEDQIEDIRQLVDFEDVQDNFVKSAKFSIDSNFNWIGDKKIGACDLILHELLPIARHGLQKQQIQSEDIDRYLGIIEERAKRHMNGARWQLRAFTSLRKQVSQDEAVSILTASMIKNQANETPVHLWENSSIEDLEDYRPSHLKVVEFMQTDLLTVQRDDIIELVAELMDWHNIRHMPVENKKGELSGIISSSELIKHFARKAKDQGIMVQDIMVEQPITVEPETTIVEAMRLMRKYDIGCLPVVQNDELIGLIEEMDFLDVTVRLIDRLER